jgi:hypothetical protein
MVRNANARNIRDEDPLDHLPTGRDFGSGIHR